MFLFEVGLPVPEELSDVKGLKEDHGQKLKGKQVLIISHNNLEAESLKLSIEDAGDTRFRIILWIAQEIWRVMGFRTLPGESQRVDVVRASL